MVQQYSEKVQLLYDEMVSDGRMRPISLDNIARLRSIEQTNNFQLFLTYLQNSCANAKVINKDTAVTTCLLMLTCKGYDFNPYNVKCLDTTAVESYWRATSSARSILSMFNSNAARQINSLIMGRDILLFQKFMKSIRTDGLLSLKNPDKVASLTKREAAIRPSDITSCQLRDFAVHSATQLTYPTAYKDYYDMIMSNLGYQDGRPTLLDYEPVICECNNKVTALNIESDGVVDICPTHGAQEKCRIALMKSGRSTLVMYSSQCRHPSRHLDRCMTMPLKIQDEVSQLLNSMGYFEVRSFTRIHEDGLAVLSTERGRDDKLKEMRQYLSIGSCRLGGTTVILWMIRPTINYMKCVFSCRTDQYNSLTSAIRGAVSARLSGTSVVDGLSFSQTSIDGNHITVTVSGVSASYLMQSNLSNELGASISSVSMGGSTLNVTLLSNDPVGRLVVQPVMMNAKLINSLVAETHQDDHRIQVIKELKKCTMKFKRVGRDGIVGPSLTIGENGGFQWIGNPSCLSSTMLQAFTHMSNRMTSTEFRTALSNSRSGVFGAYPSGVPKK